MIQEIAFEDQVKTYQLQQGQCLSLVHLAHQLWINQAVDLRLWGATLRDKNATQVLKIYQEHQQDLPCMDPYRSFPELAAALLRQPVPPGCLDIGKLAFLHSRHPDRPLSELLAPASSTPAGSSPAPRDVVLYGFGRIGRLLARELITGLAKGSPLRLRAVVIRDKADAAGLTGRANLLARDSIHGPFDALIQIDEPSGTLRVNGLPIQFISAQSPEQIDYTRLGIKDALIIDNTGAFRDQAALSRHLAAKGSSAVLLTAPGKGMPNIVMGVNHTQIDSVPEAPLLSAASCTTNAIAPVLAVVERHFGIEKGHIETIHAYTNDQNLVDNTHKKRRRGRAAALNMVITETGAGAAVAKVLPSLAGKLTSNAIRVPVPDGSLAILHLELNKSVSREQINELFDQTSRQGDLTHQIQFAQDQELVSSDIIGTTAAGIVDGLATLVSADGRSVVLYVWYDNEYGYSHQVMRLAEQWVQTGRAIPMESI